MGGIVSSVGDVFGSGGEKPQDITPGFNTNQYANNGAQDDAAKQQQAFIEALRQQAAGNGPSAASLMLQQQAQRNAAMQAGAAAASRGGNPALALRNAQLAGVQGMQNANQQAGIQRTQEQLGAQNMLGGALGQMRQQDQQNAGMYNDLGARYLLANQSQQSTNAGRAASGFGTFVGALSPVAGQAFKGGGGGGMPGGGGAGAASPADEVVAQGGMIGDPSMPTAAQVGMPVGPRSHVGQHFAMMAKGGKVPALVSPGERYLPPKDVKAVADGKKSPMKAGTKIPGKAVVGGDKNSYANDTVHKKLDKGGIVLPRSVTQSKDPAKAAHAFVSAILAKQGLK